MTGALRRFGRIPLKACTCVPLARARTCPSATIHRMPAPAEPILDIACLCAEWCGTCRDYRPVFEALREAMPQHRYRWIDIEDEADAIGDVDIETFPTLLVAHAGRVLFAGAVLPRLGDAQRLVAVQQGLVAEGHAPREAALGLPADQLAAFKALAQSL